jgi:uncharacterized membrane protein YciS (DUF1049 family)
MARNFLFVVVVFLGLMLATVFAALNPGLITLDLAFDELEVQKSIALTVTFGVGWLFGLMSTAVMLLKWASERRRLRKSLTLAEAEVRNLRSVPIQDAG